MAEEDENGGLRDWVENLEGGGVDEDEEDILVASPDYQDYKEAESEAEKQSLYEKLVNKTSFFRYDIDDLEEEHINAIRLMDWDISHDQVVPAAVVTGGGLFPLVMVFLLLAGGMPIILQLLFVMIPVTVFFYIVKYPGIRAQHKLVQSSEELILAILYMVVYMRSAPNLEGAVSFAARRLNGPVAYDLREIMWKLDMRVYTTMNEAIQDYVDRWRPYNKGFVESLLMLKSATEATNEEQRGKILDEAIDSLLDNTRKKMNRFARDLKMPVMVLHGIGILLPVLGIILFPLIATFMGSGGMGIYLAFIYNVVLPIIIYVIMRNLLQSRPISFASAAGNMENIEYGKVGIPIGDKTIKIPVYFISVPLFLFLMFWPARHYWPIVMGSESFPKAPTTGKLFLEMMLVLAVGIPAGVHLVLGYKGALRKQKKIQDMEKEFPEVLFELGNALNKGIPIERAVDKAARSRETLEVSDLFFTISNNIRERGMTFRAAVFDERGGAVRYYPSKLIGTIMEVIVQAVQKGPRIAAVSILGISKYLKNIRETQEKLEELLEESISSLKFLAYVIAPIIAGLAVGMGTVISKAFFNIGQQFAKVQNSTETGTGGTTGGGGTQSGVGSGLAPETPNIMDIFGVDSAIPPAILILVVGFYLIELALLIGTLYVRLESGQNPARRNLAIGYILLSSMFIFTVCVLVIVGVFGSIVVTSV
jgi:Flp pilus assembly protein TadB